MIAILGKPDATSLTLRHSGVDARAIITSRLVCSAPASQTVFQVCKINQELAFLFI